MRFFIEGETVDLCVPEDDEEVIRKWASWFNNSEIFTYVLKRINRTYEDIYLLVENIDKLSLEKKKELTIPLIKELI